MCIVQLVLKLNLTLRQGGEVLLPPARGYRTKLEMTTGYQVSIKFLGGYWIHLLECKGIPNYCKNARGHQFKVKVLQDTRPI